MKMVVALSGLLVAATLAAARTQAADVQNGRRLAQQVCAECHAVLPEEPRSPNAHAPTFQELARTPGMTSMALSVAFTTPHAGMPMFKLTSEQAADIIAYILGLRAELRGPDVPGRRAFVERAEIGANDIRGPSDLPNRPLTLPMLTPSSHRAVTASNAR
ncbi:MAG: cytochrome c [Proteobacteria bacterium]|nr:cytochrome c [Pseudomonadota bacterium]